MTSDELDKRFDYHPPKPEQVPQHAAIRALAKELAQLMVSQCPDGRELSLAITNIEQAVSWANAAINRNS